MKARGRLAILASALWSFAIGYGLYGLWAYEAAPSPAAAAPVRWPADSSLHHVAGRATLVVLAHPKCPCTRASIGELAELMARCKDRLTAYVLFIKPDGVAQEWEKTDLWRSAAAIPGVQVFCDQEGIEARRFGAASSGQTLLYDGYGRMVFAGGITAARGHYGDNHGVDAIVSLVNGASVDRHNTLVFGCPLFADATQLRQEEVRP